MENNFRYFSAGSFSKDSRKKINSNFTDRHKQACIDEFKQSLITNLAFSSQTNLIKIPKIQVKRLSKNQSLNSFIPQTKQIDKKPEGKINDLIRSEELDYALRLVRTQGCQMFSLAYKRQLRQFCKEALLSLGTN